MYKILLVEDDDTIAGAVAEHIASWGWQIRRAGGVDIVVAHAPARGLGDADDYAHMGFEAFLPLLDRYKPRYLIHGHVHMEYGRDIARVLRRGDTTIINAYERYTLEV